MMIVDLSAFCFRCSWADFLLHRSLKHCLTLKASLFSKLGRNPELIKYSLSCSVFLLLGLLLSFYPCITWLSDKSIVGFICGRCTEKTVVISPSLFFRSSVC
ncbi:hypothetical protein XENOCAPTIV_001154 [Xenoophorus captivus]|uniref:Uncharacterized protein n=1 Tax=Xenoophorus captivus TaxID=1517983 RepID=A0ABV0R640_9TELE